jgi:hypothetical protein
MQLENLSIPEVRQFMLEEMQHDIDQNDLYESPRLSPAGRTQYPRMLRDALASGTPEVLARSLGEPGLLNATETRQTKNGAVTAKVPVTAPETLAEGEFNRFYVRGVCRQALAAGHDKVEVYRAKQVTVARSESTAKIDTLVSAEKLLADIRAHIGIDTALGIPAGPNSGLSIRLKDR